MRSLDMIALNSKVAYGFDEPPSIDLPHVPPAMGDSLRLTGPTRLDPRQLAVLLEGCMTYSEKLKDPRWQKRRLEIMERDKWRCVHCADDKKTLAVHHTIYHKDAEPWEYEDAELITLCDDCHNRHECAKKVVLARLGEMRGSELFALAEYVDRLHDHTHSSEVSGLASPIATVEEAAKLSLQNGYSPKSLFLFARALKAHEITAGSRLSTEALEAAFVTWWTLAQWVIPLGSDFEEWQTDFLFAWDSVKSPLGGNPFEEALRRCREMPLPAICQRYAGRKLKLLLALCHHLQVIVGDTDFFLSVRDAAKAMESNDPNFASAALKRLVIDGFLQLQQKGTAASRKASSFRMRI